MAPVSRRDFIGMTAAVGVAAPGTSRGRRPASLAESGRIELAGDGVDLSPAEHAALLAKLTSQRAVEPDNYLLGGEVERFERRWAELLGKEAATFMPSGTLANQLALRILAGQRRRVIVPAISHIYNDTGDASQTLSGLTLLPLGGDQPTFTRDEVIRALDQTATGRVATAVGAIAIETPVRRARGAQFDWEEMTRISTLGRDRGIGLHLDGARLLIASAYSGIAPAKYAALFDTVYVSLWKCFNCGVGAILAGPKQVLDGIHHIRRMFGGNLFAGWPAAVIGGHFLDGYPERLRAAVAVSEAFYSVISTRPGFAVERVANGTNLARLRVTRPDLAGFRQRLAERGIRLGAPTADRFTIAVNETWARTTGPDLARAFEAALG